MPTLLTPNRRYSTSLSTFNPIVYPRKNLSNCCRENWRLQPNRCPNHKIFILESWFGNSAKVVRFICLTISPIKHKIFLWTTCKLPIDWSQNAQAYSCCSKSPYQNPTFLVILIKFVSNLFISKSYLDSTCLREKCKNTDCTSASLPSMSLNWHFSTLVNIDLFQILSDCSISEKGKFFSLS